MTYIRRQQGQRRSFLGSFRGVEMELRHSPNKTCTSIFLKPKLLQKRNCLTKESKFSTITNYRKLKLKKSIYHSINIPGTSKHVASFFFVGGGLPHTHFCLLSLVLPGFLGQLLLARTKLKPNPRKWKKSTLTTYRLLLPTTFTVIHRSRRSGSFRFSKFNFFVHLFWRHNFKIKSNNDL